MRPACTILLLALLGGCGHTGPWTVLERSQADKLRKPCSREFPQNLVGYWVPSNGDLAEVEAALDPLLKVEFQRRPWMTSQGPYLRQYGGFERSGHRVIYVNAVADAASDWRTRAVNICDGGAISFGAVYDLATHRYDWFQTNGPYNGRRLPASR
jgi:hypothetical protein